MSTSKLGDKQQRHELARALAEGYRFDPTNKPPLRPGTHVRLRKGDEHTVVRLESEDEVTTLKKAMEALINGETAQGTEEAPSPNDGRSPEPGVGTETP